MDKEQLLNELQFKATRSSGAGGQHVNKVSSRVTLSFDVLHSKVLTKEEKHLLYTKLSSKLSNEKVLQLHCEKTRSQHRNKEIVISTFFELLNQSFYIPKKRKPSKPSKVAIKKRIESKRKTSVKKALRQKPRFD